MRLDIALQYDYLVVGISSQLNDYRLGFNLNQVLGIDLKRLEDLPAFFEKEKKIHPFPLYTDNHNENFKECFLLSCINQGVKLFPQFKYYDYLFIYENPSPDWTEERVITSIRGITNVQLAKKVMSNELKDINMVLIDLEMHLHEIETSGKQEQKYFED
ncbi:MAG: IPExxxVDY family protein [Bacteroidota bacterium]|nr:IPExxxVDY family protein [Bacteroidota bacterium]